MLWPRRDRGHSISSRCATSVFPSQRRVIQIQPLSVVGRVADVVHGSRQRAVLFFSQRVLHNQICRWAHITGPSSTRFRRTANDCTTSTKTSSLDWTCTRSDATDRSKLTAQNQLTRIESRRIQLIFSDCTQRAYLSTACNRKQWTEFENLYCIDYNE